jgi:hypothetical protein
LRSREILGRLAGLWRRSPATAGAVDQKVAGDAAPAFPAEAYEAALDKLTEIARELGTRQERERIATITRLPQAAGFPRLALAIALHGGVGVDQAVETFAAAEFDVLARLPTEFPPLESRRTLH